jgi:hypothetical protein
MADEVLFDSAQMRATQKTLAMRMQARTDKARAEGRACYMRRRECGST